VSENGSEPEPDAELAAMTELEPMAEPEAVLEPEPEAEKSAAQEDEWGYVPMSEWGDEFQG